MIGTLLEPLLGALSVNAGRVMLGVSLIAVAFYYRRALGIAAAVQGIIAYLVAGCVMLGLLVITRIIPTVNVGLSIDYLRRLLELSRYIRPHLPI